MGDLISRKMVMEYLQEQQANVIIEKAKRGFVSADVCDGMKSAVDAFINFIVQAPSIEATPVVHGKWIRHSPHTVICSECLHRTMEIDANLCPNCGADMRKGGANQ